jgi:hypothetical protein
MMTTTSLTSNFNPSEQNSPVDFTVTVSPSTATGTVTLTDTYTDFNGNTSPPMQLASGQLRGGTFTFQTNNLLAGHHSITATYSGDSNDAGSMATLLQTVAPHI